MHKPIAHRQGLIGQLILVHHSNERVRLIQEVKALLGVGRVNFQHFCNNSGVEFIALYTCRSEEFAVIFAELIDFPLNHAANRSRQLASYSVKVPGQCPAARTLRR